MFVEFLLSDHNDGDHILVKIPRAAVEEQLASRSEFHSLGDIENETSVTFLRCFTRGRCMEAFSDIKIETVAVELPQCHSRLEVWSLT